MTGAGRADERAAGADDAAGPADAVARRGGTAAADAMAGDAAGAMAGEAAGAGSAAPGTTATGSTTSAPAAGALSGAQLEALLFVAERPLSRAEIASLAGVDRAVVDARLGDLEVSLAARGIRLVAAGERVELATAPEAGALIARYVGADATRLSPASIETLAIVAYRQPCTRAVVDRIRGVDSDYTLRTLLHRRLIVELGRAETPGRPILYGTGFEFLERFGLTSLDELPPLDGELAARLAEGQGEGSGEGSGEGGEADEPAGDPEPRHGPGPGPGRG